MNPSVWCDDCGDDMDFFDINDGPNGEYLCAACILKPQWQVNNNDDDE